MNKNTNTSGLGLSSVLTIIFVVLKLVGVITWNWWWVLSPILIDIGLTIIVLIGLVIYEAYEDKHSKWNFLK
jgi:hypothetical protein